MSRFIIKLPNPKDPGISPIESQLEAVGLSHLAPGVFAQPMESGPDGQPCTICSRPLEGANAETYDLTAFTDPTQWTWISAMPWDGMPADRYSIGIKTDSPPTPGDLEYGPNHEGLDVIMGDNRIWFIPPMDVLPHSDLLASLDEESCDDAAFKLAYDALSRNYMITPEVVSYLGLIDNGTLVGVRRAATARGESRAVRAAAASASPGVVAEPYTDADLRSELRDIVEVALEGIVQHELSQTESQQVYIVFASEIPGAENTKIGGGASMYFSWLPEIQEAIGESWQGKGCTIVFNDLVQPLNVADWFPVFAGTCLHEIAHYIQPGWTQNGFFYTPERPSQEIIDKIHGLMDTHADDWQETRENPLWHGHAADFVRACCHLAYRLNTAGGVGVKLDKISSPWSAYGVTDFQLLFALCLPEILATLDLPVSEAILTPPSTEFVIEYTSQVTGVRVPVPEAPVQVEVRASSVSISHGQPSQYTREEFQELRQSLKSERRTLAAAKTQ